MTNSVDTLPLIFIFIITIVGGTTEWRAGDGVAIHSPLTQTAQVQLQVALSSLTQAIILSWVGELCRN